MAQGTPEHIVKIGEGQTARFLKEVLARRPLKRPAKAQPAQAAE